MYLLTNGEGGVGTDTTIAALRARSTALDAIEAGIKVVERDAQCRTVGYGGAPNALGEMELDASVMCGTTLRVGAVGALKGFIAPIAVARQVMERLPHVMLVGDGAARFAHEIGAERGENLSPEAKSDYEQWLKKKGVTQQQLCDATTALASKIFEGAPQRPFGTTTYLAIDAQGQLGGGVSTSGWAYKYPGRLGDSPIIGAGLYVDTRNGGATCTHTGEMTIRCSTARSIVLYMKKGATVEDACREALDDLRFLSTAHLGPVVIHALSPRGEHCVITTGNDGDVPYWYWDGRTQNAVRGVPLR